MHSLLHSKMEVWQQNIPKALIYCYQGLKKLLSKAIWAATWQNQQSDCAPSED